MPKHWWGFYLARLPLRLYHFEPAQDLTYDDRDNAHWMIKGQVVARLRRLSPLAAPLPGRTRSFFEAHVKGLTYKHPAIPKRARTHKALAPPQVMIEHYRKLGITSLELLPVHSFIHDHFLIKRNLTNYWGYNTLNFFTPQRPMPQGRTRQRSFTDGERPARSGHRGHFRCGV